MPGGARGHQHPLRRDLHGAEAARSVGAKIRAGVICAGAWSESAHLPVLSGRDDVDLVVVHRPDGSRARAAAERFGATHSETVWPAALAHQLDVVVVSSPPVAHLEQVRSALESGAHVLVEKPFALHAADAEEMARCAAHAGRSLLVGFGWCATPVFITARELIERGELGPIEHVVMHLAVNTRALLSGGTDGGWAGAAESDPATYTDPAVSGGGTAAVSMSHQLGLLMWLTGQEITEVSARTWPPAARMDLHDAVIAVLSGGGNAVLSCASTYPDSARPLWHVAIHGGRGQLRIDTATGELRLVRADGSRWEPAAEPGSGDYRPGAPTEALVDVAHGAQVPSGMSAAVAVGVARVTDAIYRSAENRMTVRVE